MATKLEPSSTLQSYIDSTVVDPRLGRHKQKDPRSASFPMCAMLQRIAYEEPRSKLWSCTQVLNQGNTPACVGFAYSHDLIASPYPIKRITNSSATKVYKVAQELDEWPGSAYAGTSVLAGAKAMLKLYPGTMESYRWATNIQDVIATLGYHGPVIFGIQWRSGMYIPDANGYIHVLGNIVGGHALLAIGVNVEKSYITLLNSWGNSYGKNGRVKVSFQDIDRLIQEGGDCCVPITRNWWRKG